MNFSSFSKTVVALALFCVGSLTAALAEPWSFGVIADTQWSGPDDGKNPNSVAADIIRQVDAEFIAKGVKLVVAVGDTVDKASKASIDTRALYAQDLYNAGIAFYPLRGNHDAAWAESGGEFARVYPQIGTGLHNDNPPVVDEMLIPAADRQANPPAAKAGKPFTLGGNFSAPETNALYKSLSYSFDYNNARFVLLDQFGDTGSSSTVAQQLGWISSRLSDPKRPQQAFVFGHKNLRGGGHKDNLFGDAPSETDPTPGAFLAALAQNRVHYYISGHDHYHSESVLTTPEGGNAVHQIICASDSNKFYAPKEPCAANQKSVSFDAKKIGYYLFTVDGPRVTMDYYGVDVSAELGQSTTFKTTPQLTGRWQKLLSSSYRLEEAGK